MRGVHNQCVIKLTLVIISLLESWQQLAQSIDSMIMLYMIMPVQPFEVGEIAKIYKIGHECMRFVRLFEAFSTVFDIQLVV